MKFAILILIFVSQVSIAEYILEREAQKAEWTVQAEKQSLTRLTVTPTSNISFTHYNATVPALYQVKITNTGLNNVANFKLEVKAGVRNTLTDSNGNTVKVQLSKNGMILKEENYFTLVDGGNAVDGLIGLTGNSAESGGQDVEFGTDFFAANLTDFMMKYNDTMIPISDPSLMPAGMYIGNVEAIFKATWFQ